MLLRKIGVGALAAVAGIGITGFLPAGADAPAPEPTISFHGAIVSDGTTARVHVTYTCSQTVTPFNHLFVAVKQGPDVSPENASSETAHITTFLSTNWNSDAGPNALICNGKAQHQTIVLAPQPGFPSVALKSGPVLLQLCIFDNVIDPNDENSPGGFNLNYTMQKAVVTGGQHH